MRELVFTWELAYAIAILIVLGMYAYGRYTAAVV